MKDIEGTIVYIETTETDMKSLIKLYQVGALPKTISRYSGMNTQQSLMFIRMARTGLVRYLYKGQIRTIEVKSIQSKDYVKSDIEDEWVSEDLYGGRLGRLPKFKILWKNEMTIKEYKQFKENQNGKNEKSIH